jgi:DNA polymerase III alpha subunit (gram-positive type)
MRIMQQMADTMADMHAQMRQERQEMRQEREDIRQEMRQEREEIHQERRAQQQLQQQQQQQQHQQAPLPPPPPPVPPRDKHQEFMSHKPPTFASSPDPLDADDWLKSMEKILIIAQCSDREKVLYASGRLTGPAADWWDSYTTAHDVADYHMGGVFYAVQEPSYTSWTDED